jgi:hypothetical protein
MNVENASKINNFFCVHFEDLLILVTQGKIMVKGYAAMLWKHMVQRYGVKNGGKIECKD